MKRFVALMMLTMLAAFFIYPQQALANIRPVINKIVYGIEKYNVLDGEKLGIGGKKRSEQYERFLQLKSEATTKELIELTDYENAVVRCYSFEALAERYYTDIFPILLKHLNDYAEVECRYFDLVDHEMVGDYFLNQVCADWQTDRYKLNKEEQEKIKEILLSEPGIKLDAKHDWLVKMSPEEKYYKRIKEIYQTEKNTYAIVALAKYHKAEDVPLIAALLQKEDDASQRYGLVAAIYYPDPAFFPLIKNIHSAEIRRSESFAYPKIRALYQAIVQYKDAASKALLEETIAQAKDFTLEKHTESIELALEKYPDKAYDGISQKLNLSEMARIDIKYSLETPAYQMAY